MGTSVSQLTHIVSRATRVPLARCKQVARGMLETDMLPRSSGAHVATVGNIDAVILLLGVLAQTENYAAPGVARSLFDLRSAESRTLGHSLVELLTTVRVLDDGADTALNGEIVVDSFTPRAIVRLNVSGEAVESVYAAPGVDALTDEEVRRLVVVPTVVLAQIAIALGRNATVINQSP